MLGSIELARVVKQYKTFMRRRGLGGAILDLFRRDYHLVKALDYISFTIYPGEIVGYIGPNGAGKSTTLKIIAGVLYPTAGRVRINGFDPWTERRQHCRHIGVLFGHRSQLGWNLPVIESFHFLKEIYSVPQRDYRQRLEELVESLDLEPLLSLPVRELSLGQRTRCEIAAILLHDPAVVLLDEPTIGLDLEVKLKVRDFLRELNTSRGTTVLLASHDLQDIEGLAERVLVIDQGQLIFDGPLRELRHRYSPYTKRVVLRFQDRGSLIQAQNQVQNMFKDLKGERDGLDLILTLDEGVKMRDLIGLVPQDGLRDIAVEDPPIEDVVLEIYKRRDN